MNTDEIRFLTYYFIPKDWKIHLIDRNTNEKQLELIQQIIENARLFAFDTETMPSFYHQNKCHSINKPSLLQVAVRDQYRTGKNVLLFDLQELFDHFHSCNTIRIIHYLIELIFNHPYAYKLSQSLFNDLAHLKCSYDNECFHRGKLHRLIELSDLYRHVFSNEKEQKIYGLQRMTAMTLHCQLDKKQQCANWSKRPLTQSLKDYAAMDVIVMIDIYERLKTKISEVQEWESFQQLITTSIDLTEIILYHCPCGERFITNKTRNKHARTCPQARISEKTSVSPLPELDYDTLPPRGRGYIPPALKHAYQISLHEQVRCSSAFDEFNQLNENRPPDAQFFLEDDDTEIAQAFGIQLSKPKVKQNLKIAAYPPKTNCISHENILLDRLQDDFDSQPEFHCHLFGLGGRGRSLSMHSSPPEPGFIQPNDCR